LASSTTKTGRHDIAEILLKVALNTKNQSINQHRMTNKNSIISYQANNKQKKPNNSCLSPFSSNM
jgi:hypothetical protein